MQRLALIAALGALGLGCSQESRLCRSERDRAQEIVKALDSKSTESLGNAVRALEAAVTACEKASMGAEREKLVQAKNEIAAHLALLEKRARRKKAASPEELRRLEREGDPTCPKGQGYKQAGVKEIKCTGPQLVDMSMDAAEQYFSSRHYKLAKSDAPPRLRAEQGAEVYVFTYDKPNDTAGPKCLELYPIPGVPLAEAVGRATGARLEKLKSGGSVKAERGELALLFEEANQKLAARIGSCGG
jgi:hypothetical protein